MTAYEKIKEIFDGTRLDFFSMAVAHLMDIGWREAESMTDEEIEEIEMPEHSIFTTEFARDLNRKAREIAKACSPVEFIQFCQVEKLYDTKGFKTRKR